MSRTILFHYHFFKNAGTSVDRILASNFGVRSVHREFAVHDPVQHQAELAAWIEGEPEALSFSSHTATLPPPQVPGVKVIPIVFVRHPIDRVASVYSFERKQLDDTGFGAVLAQNTSLAGYIKVRLAFEHDRQCRDFHADRLARMFPASEGSELARAQQALEQLPFVGIVEQFDASMERLRRLIKPEFPDFEVTPVAENVSRDIGIPLTSRLKAMEEELGAELFARLRQVNANDLALYQNALLQQL